MFIHRNKISLFTLLFCFTPFLPLMQAQALEIWQIQGSGALSTFQGQQVLTTANVITAVGNGFFFMQSPDAQADQSPLTSNGIYVASAQASSRKVGDLVTVQGMVLELDGRTQIGQGNVQVNLVSSGESLPQPVVLDQNFPTGLANNPSEFEALEGMRLRFEGFTSGPADYRSMVPVVAGNRRPFREPGIAYPGLPALPVWDANPEIFWLLPNALGGANNRFISGRTPIQATGPLFQSGREYVLFPESYSLGEAPGVQAVREPLAGEVRLASLNARRLEEQNENFDQQVKKLARYIVEMLGGPELIALQEVGSVQALATLRFFIQQQQPLWDYTPLFLAGNDDIHLAFLVRSSFFQDIEIRQLGKQATLAGGGILFDRPPLLFTARLSSQPEVYLQVLNIHLRSLLGIEGSNESFVREKRYGQSLAVAQMVQELRDENLFLIGDFNAYPFTDGYVDVVGQIAGLPGLGAQYPLQDLVDPPLRVLGLELPASEQYSYIFEGSAQLIDHALCNDLQGLQVSGLEFARANADFPDAFAPNDQLVQRASDHDAFVLYLRTDQPSAMGQAPYQSKHWRAFPNPLQSGQELIIAADSPTEARLQLVSAEGRICWSHYWRKGDRSQRIPAGLSAGVYYLREVGPAAFCSQKIIVVPSN